MKNKFKDTTYFWSQMYRSFLIFFFVLFSLSCSKEEDIPFIASDDDSLNPDYYKTIEGYYKGTIYDGTIKDNKFIPVRQYIHYVNIKQLGYHRILIEDISNNFKSNAEANLYRLDKSGGYLKFDPFTMEDSCGIDTIIYSPYYKKNFNGDFIYKSGRISYLFFYDTDKETIHQYFEGNLVN